MIDRIVEKLEEAKTLRAIAQSRVGDADTDLRRVRDGITSVDDKFDDAVKSVKLAEKKLAEAKDEYTALKNKPLPKTLPTDFNEKLIDELEDEISKTQDDIDVAKKRYEDVLKKPEKQLIKDNQLRQIDREIKISEKATLYLKIDFQKMYKCSPLGVALIVETVNNKKSRIEKPERIKKTK